MFAANDILQLTQAGVEKYKSKFAVDDEFLVSKVIQETDEYAEYFIITNLSLMKRKKEPQKPLALTRNPAHTYFKQSLDDDGCALFYLYDELSRLSDEQLNREHPNWLKKRDIRWSLMAPFQSDKAVLKYLLGQSGRAIAQHAIDLNVNGKAIRRPLNYYISFGFRKNALLPIDYAKSGNRGPRDDMKKTGPKPKTLPDLATRMVRSDDILKVQRLALRNCVDKKDGKFCLKHLHTLFLKEYCSTKRIVKRGNETHFELVIDVSKRINAQQFNRLFNKAFDSKQQQVLKIGKSAYQNNRKDKTGNAAEGIERAGQLCESDSTELTVYVAYPLNIEKREAVGKVYICIVVCVKTQLVMGYSLNFGAPQWMSVAEALINCVQNKQVYAEQYNVQLDDGDWPCQHFPEELRVDNGGENTPTQFMSVLNDELGISCVDYCPPARGAAKGTVENILRIIQSFISNVTGSVEKGRDAGLPHPSQRAIFQIDDIHRFIIRAISIHNSMHARDRLLTVEMATDDVTPTPSAMWSHLMNDEFLGRPKISQKRLPELMYSLMPKQPATVARTEVKLNGLGYHSKWAEAQGWFAKAVEGHFKVDVISLGGSVDEIYFKDDSGELQSLALKDEYESYRGMTAQQAQFRLDEIKSHRKVLEYKKENALVNFEHEIEQVQEYRLKNDFKDAPPNTQKTIQSGIAERKAIMIEDEQRQKAEKQKALMQLKDAKQAQHTDLNDDDDYEGVY
ncbi:hypothetical protein [Pseudoalteromonas sp.]|uniref:hypothetical protein n=1 Tax=Pseudoalteromonas sp. TaxID=53249 RepID=UPI0035178938